MSNGGNFPFNKEDSNGFNNGGVPPVPNGNNPDNDELLCSRCMVRVHDLETKLGATNVCVSNLKDTKSSNIDSAIMVEDRIYRG